MATYLGKNGVIKAAATGESPVAVGEVTSFTVDTTGDPVEDTEMGDAARTYKPGLTSFTVGLEAHYDPADAAQTGLIEGAEIDFELLPESGNKLTGSAIVTSVSISTEFDNTIISCSVNAQGTGALTRAAVV